MKEIVLVFFAIIGLWGVAQLILYLFLLALVNVIEFIEKIKK